MTQVTAGQRAGWHLPARSTRCDYLKWDSGSQWAGSTSGKAFRLGIVEREIILKQAGEAGEEEGSVTMETGSIFWGSTQP